MQSAHGGFGAQKARSPSRFRVNDDVRLVESDVISGQPATVGDTIYTRADWDVFAFRP
jgi:hypothetical protein